MRIQQLEEQIRVLTGQVEGLQFQLTQMQTLIEEQTRTTSSASSSWKAVLAEKLRRQLNPAARRRPGVAAGPSGRNQ